MTSLSKEEIRLHIDTLKDQRDNPNIGLDAKGLSALDKYKKLMVTNIMLQSLNEISGSAHTAVCYNSGEVLRVTENCGACVARYAIRLMAEVCDE